MKPLISFYSTAYRQKQFLRGYFDNLLSINNFDKCELVMVKPATNDSEENAIYEEYRHVPNFRIIEVEYDLGLYGCWNEAIKHCKSDIITNANTDDRRLPNCVDLALEALNKGADLVFGDYYICDNVSGLDYPFTCTKRSLLPEYTIGGMIKYCLAGHAPFWKKIWMDERGFRLDMSSAADLDFWLRMIRRGAKFKKINELMSVYYLNPAGASTDPAKEQKRVAIEQEIKKQYSQVFMYSCDRNGKLEDIWIPV